MLGSFCCSFVCVIVVIVHFDFFAGAVSRTKVAAMPLLCRQQLQRLAKQKQRLLLLLLHHRPAPTKPLVAKQGVVVCSRELRLLSSVACTCDLYCGSC